MTRERVFYNLVRRFPGIKGATIVRVHGWKVHDCYTVIQRLRAKGLIEYRGSRHFGGYYARGAPPEDMRGTSKASLDNLRHRWELRQPKPPRPTKVRVHLSPLAQALSWEP